MVFTIPGYSKKSILNRNLLLLPQNKKSRAPSFQGSSAICCRHVTFRTCLTAGLALSHIIYLFYIHYFITRADNKSRLRSSTCGPFRIETREFSCITGLSCEDVSWPSVEELLLKVFLRWLLFSSEYSLFLLSIYSGPFLRWGFCKQTDLHSKDKGKG